jgi:hypothetical protein
LRCRKAACCHPGQDYRFLWVELWSEESQRRYYFNQVQLSPQPECRPGATGSECEGSGSVCSPITNVLPAVRACRKRRRRAGIGLWTWVRCQPAHHLHKLSILKVYAVPTRS